MSTTNNSSNHSNNLNLFSQISKQQQQQLTTSQNNNNNKIIENKENKTDTFNFPRKSIDDIIYSSKDRRKKKDTRMSVSRVSFSNTVDVRLFEKPDNIQKRRSSLRAGVPTTPFSKSFSSDDSENNNRDLIISQQSKLSNTNNLQQSTATTTSKEKSPLSTLNTSGKNENNSINSFFNNNEDENNNEESMEQQTMDFTQCLGKIFLPYAVKDGVEPLRYSNDDSELKNSDEEFEDDEDDVRDEEEDPEIHVPSIQSILEEAEDDEQMLYNEDEEYEEMDISRRFSITAPTLSHLLEDEDTSTSSQQQSPVTTESSSTHPPKATPTTITSTSTSSQQTTNNESKSKSKQPPTLGSLLEEEEDEDVKFSNEDEEEDENNTMEKSQLFHFRNCTRGDGGRLSALIRDDESYNYKQKDSGVVDGEEDQRDSYDMTMTMSFGKILTEQGRKRQSMLPPTTNSNNSSILDTTKEDMTITQSFGKIMEMYNNNKNSSNDTSTISNNDTGNISKDMEMTQSLGQILSARRRDSIIGTNNNSRNLNRDSISTTSNLNQSKIQKRDSIYNSNNISVNNNNSNIWGEASPNITNNLKGILSQLDYNSITTEISELIDTTTTSSSNENDLSDMTLTKSFGNILSNSTISVNNNNDMNQILSPANSSQPSSISYGGDDDEDSSGGSGSSNNNSKNSDIVVESGYFSPYNSTLRDSDSHHNSIRIDSEKLASPGKELIETIDPQQLTSQQAMSLLETSNLTSNSMFEKNLLSTFNISTTSTNQIQKSQLTKSFNNNHHQNNTINITSNITGNNNFTNNTKSMITQQNQTNNNLLKYACTPSFTANEADDSFIYVIKPTNPIINSCTSGDDSTNSSNSSSNNKSKTKSNEKNGGKLSSSSVSEDVMVRNLSFNDFLYLANCRFLDDYSNKSKRASLIGMNMGPTLGTGSMNSGSINGGSSGNVDDEEQQGSDDSKELRKLLINVYCHHRHRTALNNGYEELKRMISQINETNKIQEDKLSSSNPPIFQHIQLSSKDDLLAKQHLLKKIKNTSKLNTQHNYIKWRTDLEKKIQSELTNSKDELLTNLDLMNQKIQLMKATERQILGDIQQMKSTEKQKQRELESYQKEIYQQSIKINDSDSQLSSILKDLQNRSDSAIQLSSWVPIKITNSFLSLNYGSTNAMSNNKKPTKTPLKFSITFTMSNSNPQQIINNSFKSDSNIVLNSNTFESIIFKKSKIESMITNVKSMNEIPEVLRETSLRLNRIQKLYFEISQLETMYNINKKMMTMVPSTYGHERRQPKYTFTSLNFEAPNGSMSSLLTEDSAHLEIQISNIHTMKKLVITFQIPYYYPRGKLEYGFISMIGQINTDQVNQVIRENNISGRELKLSKIIQSIESLLS
eukprot:gene2887-3589_t